MSNSLNVVAGFLAKRYCITWLWSASYSWKNIYNRAWLTLPIIWSYMYYETVLLSYKSFSMLTNLWTFLCHFISKSWQNILIYMTQYNRCYWDFSLVSSKSIQRNYTKTIINFECPLWKGILYYEVSSLYREVPLCHPQMQLYWFL